MMVAKSRANAEWSRYLVVGAIFAASVAGMILRPIERQSEAPARPPQFVARDPRLGVAVSAQSSSASSTVLRENPANRARRAALAKNFADLALRFEPNRGQSDSRVKFLSRGSNSTLFLTDSSAVLAISSEARHSAGHSGATVAALSMSLAATRGSEPYGVDPLPGVSNYFIGSDSSSWHTQIPNFAKVEYKGIYPGVDLVYYGNRHNLEYDFIIAPRADARRIRWNIEGARRLSIARNGDLVMNTAAGDVTLMRPVAYQTDAAGRQAVDARYILAGDRQVGLRLGAYDPARALVIDPVLIYSTFLGGTNSDSANAIAIDSSGDTYVTGQTLSTDFPVGQSAVQTGLRSPSGNAFVTELNPSGSALIYSTYIGGTGNGDSGYAIAVDSSGDAYIAGSTASSDFPNVNAFQTSLKSAAGNGFVTKLNATGSAVLYSSFLGGTGANGDVARAIAVDSTGIAYVAGVTTSSDFPTQAALQGSVKNSVSAGFVSAISSSGSSLTYSTYLGGSGSQGDAAYALVLDSSADAYVAGSTSSSDFATTTGAYQTALNGSGFNAFFTEIKSGGASIAYSTYLGGSSSNGATAYGIAVDSTGAAYLTGSTNAGNFPVTNGAAQSAYGGRTNAFVSKITPSGNGASDLAYSTYLGGSTGAAAGDTGNAIAVDANGFASVTGIATSSNFPVTIGAYQSSLTGANGNAFLTRLNASGTVFLYSTYIGGTHRDSGAAIVVDSSGDEFIAGSTTSPDFPTTPSVFRPVFTDVGGGKSGFIAKLSAAQVVSIVPATVNFDNQLLNIAATPQIVTITNNSAAPLLLSPAPTLTGPNVGEFSVASACGTNASPVTLAPNTGCNVSISFTPTVIGTANATLTFSDDDPSSPQVIPVTGTGILDFSISAPSSESVSVGNTVTFSVTVTPIDFSTQTINLTCTGAPALTTCTLSPTSLTLDGIDTATSTATITTTGQLVPRTDRRHGPNGFRGPALIFSLGLLLSAIAFAMAKRRAMRLGFSAAALACVLIAGCGGGQSTPQGVTTLAITGVATPGGQNHSADVTLTVN
jgi:hypothetical protein